LSDFHHAADDNPPSRDLKALFECPLADEAATTAFGAALAPALLSPDAADLVIWLTGNLGAGKTTLTRGLLRALGHHGNVKSPTYTLLEPYSVSRMSLYHFDFYRFNQPDEFLDAGLDEYFSAGGVCLVEWAEKAAPYVAEPDIEILLRVEGAGRHAEVRALSARGRACLSQSSLQGKPS
jgi:tRNA threonylcarbamoyladenosine biosynthesis protein TsaE